MKYDIDHIAVENAMRAQRRKKTKLALIVFAVVFLTLLAFFYEAWVIVLLLSSLVFFPFLSRGESEYYALPFSRDAQGNHRCVFCGNRGIYRHGEYKSDTKYADCSKCGKNLWTE